MALDDLADRIELLRSRIRSHRTTLEENETRTRTVLIDPLLHALGWDVSDPTQVTTEYSIKGGKADYALLRPEGRPVATVEAKKLGTALNTHQMQMVNYAVASGIRYTGLTNGDNWELYDVLQERQLEDKRIMEVSISTAPVQESALKLLVLWRPNLASGHPVPASAPIIGDARLHEPFPIDVERASLQQLARTDWIALSEYNPPSGTQCPTSIKFWDGSEQNLQYWYEVLTFVVEKLCSTKLLTVNDSPIKSSNKSYVVNTEPIHPTGTQFKNYQRIKGASLFVNVNLNARQIRQNAKNLLQRYGRNAADVYLHVTE